MVLKFYMDPFHFLLKQLVYYKNLILLTIILSVKIAQKFLPSETIFR